MDKKELLSEIENDKILNNMQDTLKETIKNANEIREEARFRRYKLLDKLHSPGLSGLGYYDNLGDIEEAVQNLESRETIALKIIALGQLIETPWKWDRNYKEALKQYLNYLVPILKDIEKLKEVHIRERTEIRAKYEKRLKENQKEINYYEELVKRLMSSEEGLYSEYKFNNRWRESTGLKIIKSHEFIRSKSI